MLEEVHNETCIYNHKFLYPLFLLLTFETIPGVLLYSGCQVPKPPLAPWKWGKSASIPLPHQKIHARRISYSVSKRHHAAGQNLIGRKRPENSMRLCRQMRIKVAKARSLGAAAPVVSKIGYLPRTGLSNLSNSSVYRILLHGFAKFSASPLCEGGSSAS